MAFFEPLLRPSRPRASARAGRPDGVVLYGSVKPALRPDAEVWRGLDGVGRVLTARHTFNLLRLDPAVLRHSVLIPLRQRQVARYRGAHWGLMASRQAVAALGNKLNFSTYALRQGLGRHVPRLFEGLSDASFPVVLKRLDLSGGEGVAVVRSRAELKARMAMPPWRGHRVLLQSFVEGRDGVVHGVCRDGRFLWHCNYEYELEAGAEVQTAENVGVRRRVGADRPLLDLLERFLVPLGFDGPLAADYRRTAGGEVTVIEINPRFGGSLMRPDNVGDLREALRTLLDNAVPPWR